MNTVLRSMHTGLSGLMLVLLLGLLVGCGGGGGDGDGGPAGGGAPAPAGIGAAGGTVAGPAGARLVVPAGALSQAVDLAVVVSSQGAPALPEGTEVVGAVHAITPHGTAFATPATVSIPFDPSQVPAGREVQLLKAEAGGTEWLPVAGASVSANLISAPVGSLSWFVPGLLPMLPTITQQPAGVLAVTGGDASFDVVAQANGGGPLTYQWRRDGVDIPGATAAAYMLTGVALTDDGAQFSVRVSNAIGSVLSDIATLSLAQGWWQVGPPVASSGALALGGVAVRASDGRIAVSFRQGASVAEDVYVREWDGLAWVPLGGRLNDPGEFGQLSNESIVYDGDGNPVVTWVTPTPTRDWVVLRWDRVAGQWQRLLPNPTFFSAAALGSPAVRIDPSSGRIVVSLVSGLNHTVRDWTGADWAPGPQFGNVWGLGSLGPLPMGNGDRFMLRIDSPEGGDSATRIASLFMLDGLGGYDRPAASLDPDPTVIQLNTTPIPSARLAVGVGSDGQRPFALIGDCVAGPVLVRRWTGSRWLTLGGDTGIRGNACFGLPMHVSSESRPFVVHPAGSDRLGAAAWDGSAWNTLLSPANPAIALVGWALTVGPGASANPPHVAVATRPAQAADPNATEIRVLRAP